MSDEGAAPAAVSEPVVTAPAGAPAAVTEPVVETPKVVEQPKEDPRMASKLAHLTKRERDLQKQAEELKTQQKEMETWRTERQNEEAKKAKAKEDPISFMRQHGLEFDDIVSFVSEKGGVPPPPDPIKQEIQELRESLNKEKAEREAVKAEIEAAKREKEELESTSRYSAYVNTLTKDLESYPLTKVYTPIEQIVEIVNAHWEETGGANGGKLLTNEQVLQLCEDEWERKLEAIKEVPKVREKFGFLKQPEQVVKTETAPKAKEVVEVKESVTLSNKNGAGVVNKSLDEMSLEQRKEIAAEFMRKARRK